MPTTLDELHQLFNLQKAAYAKDAYPSFATRKDRLDRMISLLLRGQQRLCAAIEQDFGRRSADISRTFDILPPINSLKYARKRLRRWMKPERRSSFPYSLFGARSAVHYIPLGVVANISPWNFPVTLSLCPMGGLLAAGNRVILKPSELTPATAEAVAELVSQDFAAEEVAVVTGDAELGAELSRLPFDHVLFTGSTQVGRHIARATAENLVPTTLELGGKSPVIVSRTANLTDVAKKLVFSKTINAGQICIAPDFVMVEGTRREALIEEIRRAAASMYPDGAASKDYVNMVSSRHAERLRGLLREAETAGNRVIPLFEGSGDDRCLPPHIVLVDRPGIRLMDEEIFGPILPVLAVDSFDEMLAQIRSRPRPLALYYMGTDETETRRLVDGIACGGMVVNDMLFQYLQDDLPFGGVGDSGTGSYHGKEGFVRFSHAKAVYTQAKFDLGAMLRPPYGARFRRMLDMQIKG